MGVDYTAYTFYGARLTDDEFKRIYEMEDTVDQWHIDLGMDYKGTDTIVPVETGAAAYSGEGGQLFIAAKGSLVKLSRRDRSTMSLQLEQKYVNLDEPHNMYAVFEADVRRFVMDHKIPVDAVGWFIGMRVS